jgi:hypothetical protein
MLLLLVPASADAGKPSSGACAVRTNASSTVYGSVQAALDASPAGAHLRVTGTCVGPVVVSKDATISGPHGHGPSATLDGNLAGSVLTIQAGATVTLARLNLTNGSGFSLGGGIQNEGTLIARRLRVADNRSIQGGGLANLGSATVVDSVFVRNGDNRGGNIYNAGTLTLKRSTLSEGGGRFGQGLWNVGTATLIRTKVTANDTALSPLSGGGIENDGDLTLVRSTVIGNTSVFGGGIINTGTARLILSTVSGNTGQTGGGILNGPMFGPGTGAEQLILIDSDVKGNSAVNGGGIYNKGQVVLDRRSRIGGNTANPGHGGGIFNESGATVTGIRGATFTPANAPDDCFGC